MGKGVLSSGFRVPGIWLSGRGVQDSGNNRIGDLYMISKESVGVEISNRHLTIVHAKATPFSTKICAQAVYNIEAASQLDSELEAMSTKVREFLSRYSIESACIWIGLPPEMVIQRVIRLPSAAKENLGKALEYELQKYIPLESESIYFRYQVLDEDRDERQIKILVAAVKKKDLALLIEIRDHFGAGICGVESTATAGINGLKWASKFLSEKTYALAYATDSAVHLSYIEDDRLQFIQTIDLNVDLMNQSERILQELDCLEAINADPIGALNVYCHGPNATEDLLRIMNKLPNLEFSLLDLSQSQLEENDPIAGMGLALKGLQPVTVDINLLPEQFRKKSSVIGRYLTMSLVALVLLSGMAWVGSHVSHQRLVNMRVDRELNELSDEIKALGKVQSEITAFQERIDYLDNLKQKRIEALELLKALTEALPDTAWLLALSISDKKAEIRGYADQSTQLISLLEESPLFANVRFLSTITKGRDGNEVFKIGFELNRLGKSSVAVK